MEISNANAAMTISNFSHDSNRDLAQVVAMRIRLQVLRHQLPPTKVLWKVDAATTTAELLTQISDFFPLEAQGWGLEDYAVHLGGYELLHFQQLGDILKEDDEISLVVPTPTLLQHVSDCYIVSNPYRPTTFAPEIFQADTKSQETADTSSMASLSADPCYALQLTLPSTSLLANAPD